MPDKNGKRKKRIIAFGSHKGGTGKTTLSLLAAVRCKLEGRNPIVMDLDVLGTDMLDLIGAKPPDQSKHSLMTLLNDPFSRAMKEHGLRPTLTANQFDHLEGSNNSDVKISVLRTYPRDVLQSSDHRRRVFEEMVATDTPFLRRRLKELFTSVLDKKSEFDTLVLDLPGFSSGFATVVRSTLKDIKGSGDDNVPEVRFVIVTSPDIRDLRASFEIPPGGLESRTRWVVNNISWRTGEDTSHTDMVRKLSEHVATAIIRNKQQSVPGGELLGSISKGLSAAGERVAVIVTNNNIINMTRLEVATESTVNDFVFNAVDQLVEIVENSAVSSSLGHIFA